MNALDSFSLSFSTFNCNGRSNCQSLALDFIENQTKPFSLLLTKKNDNEVGNYTTIDFQKSKVRKIGFLTVYVHGLWESAAQFYDLSAENFIELYSRALIPENQEHNLSASLLLTLPGHGRDLVNSAKISSADWKLFLHYMLMACREIAENVIVIGQSTGGVLALVEALENPQLVDGLWLIEPALKISPSIENIACAAKSVIADAHELAWLPKLFGVTPPDLKIPLRYGCQVGKIWFNFLKQKGLLPNNNTIDSPDELDFLGMSRKAMRWLKTPTFLEYNPSDFIIDNHILKSFHSSNAPLRFETNEEEFHGLSATNSDRSRTDEVFLFLASQQLRPLSESNQLAFTTLLLQRIPLLYENWMAWKNTPASFQYFAERLNQFLTVLFYNRSGHIKLNQGCDPFLKTVKIISAQTNRFQNVNLNLPSYETLSEEKNRCILSNQP